MYFFSRSAGFLVVATDLNSCALYIKLQPNEPSTWREVPKVYKDACGVSSKNQIVWESEKERNTSHRFGRYFFFFFFKLLHVARDAQVRFLSEKYLVSSLFSSSLPRRCYCVTSQCPFRKSVSSNRKRRCFFVKIFPGAKCAARISLRSLKFENFSFSSSRVNLFILI